MDVEKIFTDLDSNQTHECEEAKKKLVETFTQYKEQWLVQHMADYFLKTGSLRVLEVLVKVQTPHDTFIFDRISDWLKAQTHRVQALNFFGFIIRKHPTWLFKVEKHRLIRDIFKLLLNEKEIVPLMSALLCIITLLPIIPSLVPNFLNDLFEIFGHLAAWNCQNPSRLPDDKLVHLQLGVQMLFHRLYGMYPCNFLAYLSVFIKKDKSAIFHHTIKPLLETVRVHPMLVTSTTENELINIRWKEMEPHDVVMECARLSLPSILQDSNSEDVYNIASPYLCDTPGSRLRNIISPPTNPTFKDLQRRYNIGSPVVRFDNTVNSNISNIIWSPYNEISATAQMPLTPTPSTMMMGSVTGSSPPEAAVEATPETTPMKDVKDIKRNTITANIGANPHAVRAIFGSSQPSSPMRREYNQFDFPDVASSNAYVDDSTVAGNSSSGVMTTTTMTFVEREVSVTTTSFNRKIQQVIEDRNGFQRSPCDASSTCETQEIDVDVPSSTHLFNSAATPTLTPTPIPTPTSNILTTSASPVEHECNETDRSMCTAGGLHIPTNKSVQMLAKGLKRQHRNRMASCCSNTKKNDYLGNATANSDALKVRRTKSCPSISIANDDDEDDVNSKSLHQKERRLQKSGRMLAIATATKKAVAATANLCSNAATQTHDILPQNYEYTLSDILLESNNMRKKNEFASLSPNDILNQYVLRTIRSKENSDAGYCCNEEKYQLLCLQLQYERYRREIHAERNRRLMGRSRDKRSLEMERDRLREQLSSYAIKNKELVQQNDKAMKTANEREHTYTEEYRALKAKYQNELEQKKCLRQANENLQTRLTDELTLRKNINYELEALRGQIFNMKTELQHAQQQSEMGLQCKQELAQLEAEFIVMGEVQIKCRDRLAEMDNFKARDEEVQMLQESYNIELKDIKHTLEEKTSYLDSAKHKIAELQAQLTNSEKVITEQKRLLKAVKDEYEEKFKSLNRKYDVQKTIIMQMEEKIMMSMNKPQAAIALNACSPDTDKTDVASSMDRNSPLSTSLASSESLSASLRSTELRNLQTLVETPILEASTSSSGINVVGAGANIIEGTRVPIVTSGGVGSSALIDMATSANTATSMANAINILPLPIASTAAATASATVMPDTVINAAAGHNFDVYNLGGSVGATTATLSAATATISISHTHPHLHLQHRQQQQQKK